MGVGRVGVVLVRVVAEGIWLFSRGVALAEERALRRLAEHERDAVIASYARFRRETRALLNGEADARALAGDGVWGLLHTGEVAGSPPAAPDLRGPEAGEAPPGWADVPVPPVGPPDRRRVS